MFHGAAVGPKKTPFPQILAPVSPTKAAISSSLSKRAEGLSVGPIGQPKHRRPPGSFTSAPSLNFSSSWAPLPQLLIPIKPFYFWLFILLSSSLGILSFGLLYPHSLFSLSPLFQTKPQNSPSAPGFPPAASESHDLQCALFCLEAV